MKRSVESDRGHDRRGCGALSRWYHRRAGLPRLQITGAPRSATGYASAAAAALVLGSVAAACGWRARHSDRERHAWLALTFATASWTVGAVYHLVAHGGGSTTAVPASLDAVGYALFYPAAFLGLALLVRSRLRTHATLPWLDGAIAAVGTAAAAVALVGGLLAQRAGDSPAEVLAKIGFPIGDLILLALVAVMWGLRGMRGERSWYLASGGVAVMATADLLFTAFAAQSELAVQVLRPMWGVGMILIGAGGLVDRARGARHPARRRPARSALAVRRRRGHGAARGPVGRRARRGRRAWPA